MYILWRHLTCISNSLFTFRTLTPLPFSRLFDPGGKCMYMSDMPGSKRTASKQPQTKMAFMVCTCLNQNKMSSVSLLFYALIQLPAEEDKMNEMDQVELS